VISNMRKTIRPVTLSRIVEVVDLCARDTPTSPETIKETLDLSDNRVNEILSELRRLSFVTGEEETTLTASGDQLDRAIHQGAWSEVHDLLYQASPHYQIFIDILQDRSDDDKGLTEDQLLDVPEAQEHDLRFNKTGISLLTDWGERLQAIQRNVFKGRYYLVQPATQTDNFAAVLQDEYEDMEVTRGLGMRQRYISIPKLREFVCERLHLARDTFDREIVSLAQQNIGRMELSGAPLDTQAKESRLGIKTIALSEEDGIVSTAMSSDRVLSGISMPDGKTYYYLTIFEQLMDGEHDE